MIVFELQNVQASCVLRACRAKRDVLIRDRDNLTARCDAQPDKVTIQAIEVLNAELALLDTAIDAMWLKLSGQVLTELNARRNAPPGGGVPGGN